jgi:hypothetical protein
MFTNELVLSSIDIFVSINYISDLPTEEEKDIMESIKKAQRAFLPKKSRRH